jgi:hypothetical protein
MQSYDLTHAALEDPQVGDHWKEWTDWDAYVIERTADRVTTVIFNAGHEPIRASRGVAQFANWLTFGGVVAKPWASCVARGLDVSALQGQVLPMVWAPAPADAEATA